VARETQIAEHNAWAVFLAKVQTANANKRLPAEDQKWLAGLDRTQGREERLVAKTLHEAEKWNSRLHEVSEAPGPMDALFREVENYVASYDKHLLEQPKQTTKHGKTNVSSPAGWRALGAISPSDYAGLEKGVSGMRVPLASLAGMWNDLRYPAFPGTGHLNTKSFKDPLPHVPGLKGGPPPSYASGGLAGMLDSISMIPHMASGGYATSMPDLSNIKTAAAPSVRSPAAQATSGQGSSGANVNISFGDIINPRPEPAGMSMTHQTQRAAWLAGREL
jgi:hypothetical protein